MAGVAVGALLITLVAWIGVHGTGTRSSPASGALPAPPTSGGAPASRAPTPVADRQQPPGTAAGWRALVEELYRRRAQAFATGSAGPLGDVYAPGSPLLTADERSLAALVSAGEVVRGFTPTVSAVTDVRASDARAELRLVDGWPAYQVVPAAAPSGAAQTSAPGRAEAPVRMVLVRTPAGWRIQSAQRST